MLFLGRIYFYFSYFFTLLYVRSLNLIGTNWRHLHSINTTLNYQIIWKVFIRYILSDDLCALPKCNIFFLLNNRHFCHLHNINVWYYKRLADPEFKRTHKSVIPLRKNHGPYFVFEHFFILFKAQSPRRKNQKCHKKIIFLFDDPM